MAVYYNEWEAYPAQWLRNLIAAGHLPAGDVDERDIAQVQPDDIKGYRDAHFFAGIGGWLYALRLAGWDGPVWSGSCPCQPLSSVGKRKGHADERHVWPAFFRLIAECMPPVVFGEQVASKDGREWFAGVRADLERVGYACGGADLPASSVGARHHRHRLFFVADINGARCPDSARWARPKAECNGRAIAPGTSLSDALGQAQTLSGPDQSWLVNGLSANVDAVRAYGNAIVPQIAAEFVKAYMECRP